MDPIIIMIGTPLVSLLVTYFFNKLSSSVSAKEFSEFKKEVLGKFDKLNAEKREDKKEFDEFLLTQVQTVSDIALANKDNRIAMLEKLDDYLKTEKAETEIRSTLNKMGIAP